MKCVLFLDIDGVMNSMQSVYYYLMQEKPTDNFCPIAASNLRWLLIELPDLKIVVSSTWKRHKMDRLKDLFIEHGLDPSRIIGITPDLPSSSFVRGQEIRSWLDSSAAPEFVILDDDRSLLEPERGLSKHLVLTDDRHGFQLGDAIAVISKLTGRSTGEIEQTIPQVGRAGGGYTTV